MGFPMVLETNEEVKQGPFTHQYEDTGAGMCSTSVQECSLLEHISNPRALPNGALQGPYSTSSVSIDIFGKPIFYFIEQQPHLR